MEHRKRIIMVVLSVVVCIMAIGYALLAQQLNINGTASIDSKWRIEITNITEKDIVGEAYSKVTPSYTAITANFNVGLIKPGDSITYDVEVSNLGTLKAKVDSINIATSDSDGIIYTVNGIKEGDKLAPSEKDILTIKVEYDSNVTSQPEVTSKNITIIMNYVQDMEAVVDPMPDEPEVPVSYDYVIGDKITFAGSNWYVIKNSSTDEDYVTLMKEQVLTSSELGKYYDVEYGGMAYYWSDTCHQEGSYGYTETDNSECDGYNDYEKSKVKEMLELQYLSTLGSEYLKEVDGYKIRLITWDELLGNLGYSMDITSGGVAPLTNENVPSWVYENMGWLGVGRAYWTMSPTIYSTSVYSVGRKSVSGQAIGYPLSVRPVINLLKSSI